MTNHQRYIIKLNITHYRAMQKLGLDDEKRATVLRLLAGAKGVLAEDLEEQVRL